MNFSKFYIIEEELKDWLGYVNSNPMLKNAVEVLRILTKFGKAYIVGGAVRDIILGKKPKDIDIATNVSMNKIEEIFPTHDIGKNKDFGIVVIEYKGDNIEIASFRKDGKYTDGRRPDSIEVVPDFKDDASRRDFTINAMAIDKDGNIIDYFDGQKDIKNKKLKTVGNPKDRFDEDKLRMLRAIRFASRLGFTMDDETKKAIADGSADISKIASERISKELIAMASQEGSKFADAILQMKETGLLKYILPEILKMDEFEHSVQHHPEGNVFQHTLEALKTNKLADPIINLSILFHDIGKLVTHTQDEEGIHKYLGHADAAKDLIEEIAKRLKLDNKTKESMLFAAINHMKFHDILKMSNNKIAQLMNDPNWDILKSVAEADAKARGTMFDEKEWDEIENKIADLKERFKGREAINAIKKVVNGRWIMSLRPDVKPGPKLGDLIDNVVSWILNDNIDIEDTVSIKDYILKVEV